MKFDEKALAKQLEPQIAKLAKEANRDLESIYARGETRTDRDVQRDIEKVAKKYGLEGVDSKDMTARYRAGQKVLFKAG